MPNPFTAALEEEENKNPFTSALEDEEPSILERLARSLGAGAIRAAEIPILASPLISGGLAIAKGELPGFAVRRTLEDVARNVEAQVPGGTTIERVGEQIAGGLPSTAINTALIAAGGPLASGAAGGYQAGLSAYEQARAAGESPLSAGLGAAGEAAVGAIAAPLAGAAALGRFAPQGASLVRQLLTSGAVDAITGAGQTAASLGRQAIQGQEVPEPGQPILESALANAAIGIAARGATRALKPRSQVEPTRPMGVEEPPPVTESVTTERRAQPDLREAVDYLLPQLRMLDEPVLRKMMDAAVELDDLATEKAIERVMYERSGQEAKRVERVSLQQEVIPGAEEAKATQAPEAPSRREQLLADAEQVAEGPLLPAAVAPSKRQGGEVPEFKFERLDVSENQRNELRQLLEETAPKATISWGETEAQAKPYQGQDLTKKRKLTRPEHFALEQGIGTLGKEIETLRAIPDRTPEQEAALDGAVLRRNAMFMASQAAGSETGRALNALKAFRKAGVAALKEADKARLQLSKTYWDQLDDNGKRALADLDLTDNEKVYEWLRGVEKPSILRMLTTNFKASILSGVPSNVRNIAGNLANLGTQIVARPGAAAIESVRGKFTGEAPRISLKDQPSAYRGLAEGFNSGAAKAWKILKTGQSVVDTTGADKFRIRMDPFQLSKSRVVRGVGKVITVPFRPLAAADALFSEMGFQAKRHETASEMARVKGGSAQSHMNDSDVLAAANDFAKLVTYQDKPGPIAEMVNRVLFSKRKNPVTRTVAAGGEMIMPFVNIPDRVAARMIEATPLGFLHAAGQASVEWTPEVSQRLAIGAAGSAIMGLGIAGFSSGLITAGVPKDPDERAQFYALKKRPYSIKVKGRDVPFRMLGPWGGALAIGAEAAQKAKESAETGDTEANKLIAGGIGGMLGAGKYLLDASYLQTLSKVVGAFEEGGGSQALNELRSQVYNIAAGNVPFSALLRNIAQARDKRILERPTSVVEAVQQNIPGQTKKFPARLTPYGEETKREESPAMAFIPRDAPIAALLSKNEPDPLDAELAKHGLTASYVGKKLTLEKGAGQVKLTPDQQRQYQRITGQELKKALEKLFSSSFYQRLTPERQKKRIENAMDDARTKGQILFKREVRKEARLTEN